MQWAGSSKFKPLLFIITTSGVSKFFMDIINNVFERIGFPVLALFFGFLFIMESKFQLRKRVQSRLSRILTNTGVALFAFAFLRLLFIPLVVWLAAKNSNWQFGLNHILYIPYFIEFALGFLLLDYTNYLWHVLLHKVNFLWRFHAVHHSDLDLDITTAIRFHFGEMIGSVVFRGAAILLIGASPLLVIVYEIVFEAATNFHHTNWKLPYRLEKILNKIVVTPRMHGIHHSIVQKEADSNYAVIFSFWDRLHHTLRLNVFQNELVIGLPAYRDAHELTLWQLLKMPFTQNRPWKLPDGRIPVREERQDVNEVLY